MNKNLIFLILFMNSLSFAKPSFLVSNTKPFRIVWADRNNSEIRIYDNSNRLSYWKIRQDKVQIEIYSLGTQTKKPFRITHFAPKNIQIINGTVDSNDIFIKNTATEPYQKFFNSIDDCSPTAPMDLREDAAQIVGSIPYQSHLQPSSNVRFHSSCNQDQMKIIDGYLNTASTKGDKFQRVLACFSATEPELTAKIEESFLRFATGAVGISCLKMDGQNAFASYINKEPATCNFDPKTLANCNSNSCSTFLPHLFHELTHDADRNLEDKKVKEIALNLTKQFESKSCEDGYSITGAELASKQTHKDYEAALTGTPVTTNPAVAARVGDEMNKTPLNLNLPTTEQAQKEYLGRTDPARQNALTFAGDVMQAFVPQAVAAPTLAGSNSSARGNGNAAQKQPPRPSANYFSRLAKNVTNSEPTSPKADSLPNGNENTTSKDNNKSAPTTANSETAKGIKTAGPTKVAVNSAAHPSGQRGPASTLGGGVGSGRATYDQDQPFAPSKTAGTRASDSKIIPQKTLLEILEKENTFAQLEKRLKNPDFDFNESLRKAQIRIVGSNGFLIGPKNGRIIFTIRPDGTIVRE